MENASLLPIASLPLAGFLDGSKSYITLAQASNGFVVVLQCQQNIANVPTLEPSLSPSPSPSPSLLPLRMAQGGKWREDKEGRYFQPADNLISRDRFVLKI